MSIFDKFDRTILRNLRMEHEIKHTTHIELGTPGRKGLIKVYGNPDDPEALNKFSNDSAFAEMEVDDESPAIELFTYTDDGEHKSLWKDH